MKKEWVLTVAVTIISVLVSILLINRLAPGLLGHNSNQTFVKADKKVVPFYENIFRFREYKSDKYLWNDPYTVVRAKPMLPSMQGMGPNDILGFRNKRIPNLADIVTIGDSQTYGVNVPLQFSFPYRMQDMLRNKNALVYNMSVGGWGAPQYLYIFYKSIVFRPRVVVVAFYTGNDAIDSFRAAYGVGIFKHLRPDKSLSIKSVPNITFPAPKSEWWPVTFKDGSSTVFTPKLRYGANQSHPAVKAGYQIMASVAREIMDFGRQLNIRIVFTIIPTKELVYYKKVIQDNLSSTRDYADLITAEQKNISYLRSEIDKLPGSTYVDVVTPLQSAALQPNSYLYGSDENGHPVANGYYVIGTSLSKALKPMLSDKIEGLAKLRENNSFRYILIRSNGYWRFQNESTIRQNGWEINDKIPYVDLRQLRTLEELGVIAGVNSKLFGPRK